MRRKTYKLKIEEETYKVVITGIAYWGNDNFKKGIINEIRVALPELTSDSNATLKLTGDTLEKFLKENKINIKELNKKFKSISW